MEPGDWNTACASTGPGCLGRSSSARTMLSAPACAPATRPDMTRSCQSTPVLTPSRTPLSGDHTLNRLVSTGRNLHACLESGAHDLWSPISRPGARFALSPGEAEIGTRNWLTPERMGTRSGMTRRHYSLTFGRTVAAVAAAGLLAAACGGDNDNDMGDENSPAPTEQTGAPETTESPQTGQQDGGEVQASGTLAKPDSGEGPYTYDQELAPLGAEIHVESSRQDDSTHVTLQVEDMLPDRGYAAHAHTRSCGDNGEAAGPHFQHEEDPEATPEDPSTDPDYANPENEIWLDFTTDSEGNGESETTVPFVFDDRAPGSVVIHANEETSTEPGSAGQAGDRIACISVPFGGE